MAATSLSLLVLLVLLPAATEIHYAGGFPNATWLQVNGKAKINSDNVKFDIYSNAGEGNDSTGVFTDGAAPTNPAVNLTSSGIVLSSGDTISAQLVYNGATLTLTLTDTVTNRAFSQAFTINIPSKVGGNTAYVGFTAGYRGSDRHSECPELDFYFGYTVERAYGINLSPFLFQ
jgi:hypothetical protein